MKPHYKTRGRYSMRSKAGHYVEAHTREALMAIRKGSKTFRHARITRCLQAWADVVIPYTIYPPEVSTRAEFMRFNIQGKLPAEPGAASIKITLSKGKIEIRHAEDDFLLAYLSPAHEGSWAELWKFFETHDYTIMDYPRRTEETLNVL